MNRPTTRDRERNDLRLFQLKEHLKRTLLGTPLPSGSPDYGAALQKVVQSGTTAELAEQFRELFEHIEQHYES